MHGSTYLNCFSSLCTQLDGPLYAVVQSLFITSYKDWEEHRVVYLRRLLVLAHARNSSPSPIKRYQACCIRWASTNLLLTYVKYCVYTHNSSHCSH